MKLPKMYAPVKVKFWTLRGTLGSNGGFMEIDREVIRTARRVVGRYGEWRWQIVFRPHELMHESQGAIETTWSALNQTAMKLKLFKIKVYNKRNPAAVEANRVSKNR